MTPHPIRSRLSGFFQRVMFGMLLGLILSLLFILFIFGISSFQFLAISSLVGWVLYLVIPLLAGLRTTYQTLHPEEAPSLNVGLETGVVSVLLNILTGVIVLVIVLVKGSGRLLPLIESLIFLWFLLFHMVGLLLADLGGFLGRAMRKRWLHRPIQ